MRSLRILSEPEKKDLEAALKLAKDASEWKRIFVILSYNEGQSVEELARLTRLSRWTIEEYLKQYNSHNKTKNDPGGGSASKLTHEKTRTLEEDLSQTTYLKRKYRRLAFRWDKTHEILGKVFDTGNFTVLG